MISKTTRLEYAEDQMVYISNPLQAARYIKYDAVVYDFFSDGYRITFVFSKEDHRRLFDRWCKKELL